MIGLAVEYWISMQTNLQIGKDLFYETLPIDPQTGNIVRQGIFCQTVQSSVEQGGLLHNILIFYVVIAETAQSIQTGTIPVRQLTDNIADKLTDLFMNAISDPSSWDMQVPNYEEFTDVQLSLVNTKNTAPMLPSGALVKTVTAEVYYRKKAENG